VPSIALFSQHQKAYIFNIVLHIGSTMHSFSCFFIIGALLLHYNMRSYACAWFEDNSTWMYLLQAFIFWVVDNYLKEKYLPTPTWKVSQSTCAAGAEELAMDVAESSVKHIQLTPFSRSGYTVIRSANGSDSDRLLSFDDDPGFDAESLQKVTHREDSQTPSSNAA